MSELAQCENEVKQMKNQIIENNRYIYNSQSDLKICNEAKAECLSQLQKKTNELNVYTENSKCLPNSCLTLIDGIYEIKIGNEPPFSVLCNNKITGPGWMVIQRRIDGRQDFNKDWNEYLLGFGDFHGEFFLGLEKLHLITNSQPHELHIQIMYGWNQVYNAHYDNFRIGNASTQYKLESIGKYNGNAFDALRGNENMMFSTYDKNNKCAENSGGGWWFPTHCGNRLVNIYSFKICIMLIYLFSAI